MDREAWRAATQGVAKIQTQLSDWTTTTKVLANAKDVEHTFGAPRGRKELGRTEWLSLSYLVQRWTNNAFKKWATLNQVSQEVNEPERLFPFKNILAKVRNTNNIKCWQGCGAQRTLIHCQWNAKLHKHFGRQFVNLLQNQTCSYCANQRSPWRWFHLFISNENLCPHKSPHKYVYGIFIDNCQSFEGTSLFCRWIDK